MKLLLFPAWCRKLGWIVFVPAFILALTSILFDIAWISGNSDLISRLVLAGLSLGALMIVCSKAKIEDELIASVRQASMFNSFFAYVLLLVVLMLNAHGAPLLKSLIVCAGLFPVIVVGNFVLEIYSFKRQAENEESGED